MKSLLRRHLVLLMLGVTAAAFTVSLETPAFAKDGGSGNSGSGSSGSGNSGSGSGGGGGDDNSGSGGGDGDDSSGSGGGGEDNDDNSGSSGDSDDDDANDDSNNRSASNDDRRNGGRNRADRPRVQISVDADTRAGLLNGSLVAVDNLGRPLEVEVEDGGVLIAKPHGGDAKRNPGPIASFEIVPAAQAPVHQ